MATRSPLDLLLPWANGGEGMGFNNTGSGPESDDPTGSNAALKAEVLKQALSYDPNAHFNEGTGQLEFDASGLPKFDQGQKVGAFQLANLNENDAGNRLLDPAHVIRDANYGDWTSRNNLSTAPGDSDSGFMGQLGKYMPTAISALMSMASGIPVAGIVGGLAAADSGDWKGMSMQNLLASIAGMIANQYVPGAGTAINLVNGQVRKGP